MSGSTAIGHPLGSKMIRITRTLARILHDMFSIKKKCTRYKDKFKT